MFKITEVYPARVCKRDLDLSAQIYHQLNGKTYHLPDELKHKIPIKHKIILIEHDYKLSLFKKPIKREKVVISTPKGSVILFAEKH